MGERGYELSGVMPSGHVGTLMSQRMYFIEEESTPTFDGTDLGRPTHCHPNPDIGGVPLPARGILAVGQGVWRILDPAEYERTRRETDDPTPARNVTEP